MSTLLNSPSIAARPCPSSSSQRKAAVVAARGAHSTSALPPAPAASAVQRRQALLVLQAALLSQVLPGSHGLAAAASTHPPGTAIAAAARANSLTLEPPLGFLPYFTPEPVQFPRRTLDLTFAVLLSRSMYDAVDDLDFVAMQEFQKQFWKYRASEWLPYTVLYQPLAIKQGELTNPLYSDFIAACQGITISKLMASGLQEFKERDEETDEVHDVTRDPALRDNSLLPAAFVIRAGERIYDGLLNGFRGMEFGAPPPAARGASLEARCEGVKLLLDVFVQHGYALSASVSEVQPMPGGGGTFTVELQGPANLWALQQTAAQRASVWPAHSAMATGALLRAGGVRAACRLSWNDTALVEHWSVGA